MIEPKLKVLVVEDEVMIAKHIEDILIQNDFSCVGIAHDGDTALEYMYSRQPQLVILDINLDGEKDGIDLAEIINEKYATPFLFLTALSDLGTLERAKKVNPCAYIVKPFKAKDLISSITIGLYNFEFRKQTKDINLESINHDALEPLSQKEFEVLLDIREGLTNAQIAKKQFLTLSTIKFHSSNIYTKLGVNNRSSAIKKILAI